MFAAIIVIAVPVGVLAALAISARLRGPATHAESRRPVESLVTEAVPEDHPHDAADPETGPAFNIDSAPPEPDPGLRSREPEL